MQMIRTASFLVIALMSTLVVACAGPSAAAPAAGKPANGPQDVQIKGTVMLKFEPATLTVKRDTPVRLTLTSTGALEHDWVVDNLDGKKVQVHAAPNASSTVEFTPTTAGTYQFYCSIPGHREAGLTGTLTVQ
jgi:uncharacterized cupredoxin-like copper-binding protein